MLWNANMFGFEHFGRPMMYYSDFLKNAPPFLHEAAEICGQFKHAGQDLLCLFSVRNKQENNNVIGWASR